MKVMDIIDGIDAKVDVIRQKIDKLSKERVKLCDECDILSVNLNEVRNEITNIDNIITETLHEIEVQSSIKDFLAEYAEGKDE